MLKVGLTGGIACGKSTVSRMLALKGALLLEADQLAREVVKPGEPSWKEIVDWLGQGILRADRTLDRQRVAAFVFGDKKKLRRLNAIVHPRVSVLFNQKSSFLAHSHPGKVQIWEVPLLFEAGMQNKVDYIVVVASSLEHQIKRLEARDNLSVEEALQRINSQYPLQEKISGADFVIYNDSTKEFLQQQVDLLWHKIKVASAQ